MLLNTVLLLWMLLWCNLVLGLDLIDEGLCMIFGMTRGITASAYCFVATFDLLDITVTAHRRLRLLRGRCRLVGILLDEQLLADLTLN